MNDKTKLIVRLNRARYNLLFMIILSAVNIYFVLQNGSFYLPFSSSISSYSVSLAVRAAEDLGNESFKFFGIIVALIAIAIYSFCYIKSKDNGFFLFMAFTVFVADTLALAIMTIALQSFSAISAVDFILHLMTLFFLWSGVKAQTELKRLAKQEDLKDQFEFDEDGEIIAVVPEIVPDFSGYEPITYGNYNNNKVSVIIVENKAILTINGEARDMTETDEGDSYFLCYTIDDNDYSFDFIRDSDGERYYLRVDDIILDSNTDK